MEFFFHEIFHSFSLTKYSRQSVSQLSVVHLGYFNVVIEVDTH